MQLNKLNKWQKFLGYYLLSIIIVFIQLIIDGTEGIDLLIDTLVMGLFPGMIVSVLGLEFLKMVIKGYKEMSLFRFILVLFLLYFWMINWNKYVVN